MRKIYIFFVFFISFAGIIRNGAAKNNINSISHLITLRADRYPLDSIDLTVKKDSTDKKDCEVKDISDVIRSIFAKNKNKPAKAEKKLTLLVLPSISANPQNGFRLGVSATGAMYLGPKENTNISVSQALIAVTTKSQLVSYINSGLYTKNNEFYLDGDWRFYIYRAPTFGLGTNSPPDSTLENETSWMGAPLDSISGGFPMLYNYAFFHQIVSKRIIEDLYVGIGYQLDVYWSIVDEKLDLQSTPQLITPHYTYSMLNKFEPEDYLISGLSANIMFDSRDNQLNPYKGYYFKINYRYNPEFMGSTQASSELWTEFRTYVSLSKKTPRHLIAFWVLGNFQTSGTLPYFTLFSTADDQKGRSGRGYIAGRFRGESVLYAEAEYRFPILKCAQTLGGVIFANATTATNRINNVDLFDYVRPAFGVGLRILFNKHTRLNMNIDYAKGHKSQGFYFASGESF